VFRVSDGNVPSIGRRKFLVSKKSALTDNKIEILFVCTRKKKDMALLHIAKHTFFEVSETMIDPTRLSSKRRRDRRMR
jgi:hypothetical protein